MDYLCTLDLGKNRNHEKINDSNNVFKKNLLNKLPELK